MTGLNLTVEHPTRLCVVHDKDEEIRKRITQRPSVKGAVNVG